MNHTIFEYLLFPSHIIELVDFKIGNARLSTLGLDKDKQTN